MTDQVFTEIWQRSQYNAFFWIAHLTGLTIVLLGVISGWRGYRWFKRLAMVGACIIGIIIVISIAQKWRIRELAAQTMKQKQAVAQRDGANLGASPLIGALGGALYLALAHLSFTAVAKMRHTGGTGKSSEGPAK